MAFVQSGITPRPWTSSAERTPVKCILSTRSFCHHRHRNTLTTKHQHCFILRQSSNKHVRAAPVALSMLPGADGAQNAIASCVLTLAAVSPEWEPLLQAGKLIAGPGLNIFNFVMIVRIILTWYPQTDLAKAPWIFIAVPTEPLLRATRKVIKPVGGVDISPIVWFALMSFVHEILVGPQGIFVLLSQ